MRPPFSTLDRYLLTHVAGTLGSVFGIVISLMMFEHLPRLFEIVRLSGRKAYIVVQSMLSLLPEYAAIGLLFGLYLAIALTVRRLSLRGELDVIEATGVAPVRWMRFPALVGVASAALLLLTQGWLMPAGERRLGTLGEQMQDGRYGYDLERRTFTDLGHGVTMTFDHVDRATGELRGVFIRTDRASFTASRGLLGFDFAGDVLVDLANGRMADGSAGQSLSFSRFHLDTGGRGDAAAASAAPDRRKAMTLAELLNSAKPADRAAAWSRLLWPLFALLVPSLALVLGKPARRSNSTLGLMAGLVLVVLFIRTAGLVASSRIDSPGLLAAGVAAAWMAEAGLLMWGERAWGAGYVDARLRGLTRRVAQQRRTHKEFASPAADQNLSRRQTEQTAGGSSWIQRAPSHSWKRPIGAPLGHTAPRPSANI